MIQCGTGKPVPYKHKAKKTHIPRKNASTIVGDGLARPEDHHT